MLEREQLKKLLKVEVEGVCDHIGDSRAHTNHPYSTEPWALAQAKIDLESPKAS